MTPALRSYLLFTATLCGAFVMMIEVLGSRVIGPFYGVSLFVWTALISVTLVALAGGYLLGGTLADRYKNPDGLYTVILVAGVAVLLIPLLRAPILSACQPLGLRMGALTSAGLLFGPALLLLGCVSPWVVQLAARDLERIGRTVGTFYALSTLGSFAGTVTTGFVLIAWFGTSRIFTFIGASLVLLGVAWFVGFRKRWAPAATLLALAIPSAPHQALSVTRASGTVATEKFATESFYGSIRVIDYQYRAIHTRELTIDGLVQGAMDPTTGQSTDAYSYVVGMLSRMLHPMGTEALVVGLGAGLVPRWFEAEGVVADAVDIDPVVAKVARSWFGFTPRGQVFLDDARAFLRSSDRQWDYLVLDVFNGDTTPNHLLSVEAMGDLQAHLKPGGVVAINLMGCTGPEAEMTASVVHTVAQHFDTVDIHPMFAAPQRCGNLILMAYQGPPRPLPARAPAVPIHPLAIDDVRAALTRSYRFPPDTPALLLTDDFNPMDIRDLQLKETVRRSILDGTDWVFLL